LLDSNNLKKYVNLENYIPDIFSKPIKKCHLADIIRMILLKNHGGLWADATTFCNKPLSSWFQEYIQEGFFAFRKKIKGEPNIILSNWFLYSEKNGYIIQKWCEKTLEYYTSHSKAHTYFIHHYLFYDLYVSDTKFKKIWDNVPFINAKMIHRDGKDKFLNKATPYLKKEIDDKFTPVYKLSYKLHFPPYNEKLLMYYLYSTVPFTKKNKTRKNKID
jgi:hypothetical protein